MKKISFSVVIVFLLVGSCHRDSLPVNETPANILNSVVFKKVDLNEMGEKWCGVIVEWDGWGRASKDCGGWGLCNADWFPPCDADAPEAKNTASKKYNARLLLNDELGKYFIDVLLADYRPETVSKESLNLPIDKDFIINTQKAIGKDLTFKAGVYPFDESLGEFGGIRIYLE